MSKFTKTVAGFAGSIALIASLAGSAGAATFSTTLKQGSSGPEVSALQSWLVSKGYLVMPAGVSMGYFGNLTKAAVAAYQTAKGITPAAGYFGPITMAAANAEGGAMTSTVPGCSAGAMYSSTTGAPCTTTSSVPGCSAGAMYSSTTGAPCTGGTTGTTAGITTPGVEGTLTVTSSNAGLASTVYEGDSMVAILGAKVEAKNSDISLQRVKLSLGSNTTIYNKLYKKLYVVVDGNVVASSDLNSSTVVKDGSTYYITIAGFNTVVPKGTSKQLVIKADVYGTVDSTDRTTLNTGSASQVSFANDGVRGIDGAGIDQYSPATGFGRTVTVSAELADTATLAVSTNVATPSASDVVAAQGSSENEADKVPLLIFDAKAEKDDVTLTDLVVDITYSGSGTATATTLYLYDGSTEIDSASVSATSATVAGATFSDIDYVIPRNTTKTLTVKVDIRSADGTVRTIAADIDTADVTAENARGDSITESGSAVGETLSVRNVGPVFTLLSKSITKSATAAQSNTSTSTGEATFTLKIKAVGGAIDFGTVASNSPAFGTSTSFFKIYQNGAALTAANFLVASSTAYDTPSSGVTTSGLTNTFRLEENNEITLPVNFRFEGRVMSTGALVTGASYAVGLEGIQWGKSDLAAAVDSYMASDSDWRTSTISLP